MLNRVATCAPSFGVVMVPDTPVWLNEYGGVLQESVEGEGAGDGGGGLGAVDDGTGVEAGEADVVGGETGVEVDVVGVVDAVPAAGLTPTVPGIVAPMAAPTSRSPKLRVSSVATEYLRALDLEISVAIVSISTPAPQNDIAIQLCLTSQATTPKMVIKAPRMSNAIGRELMYRHVLFWLSDPPCRCRDSET